MAETINIKTILDSTQVEGSLEELKQKFRELENVAGSSLLSKEETQQVLTRMGQIKGAIKNIEMQVDSIAQTNAFGDMVQVTTPLVGALTAAGAAASLFGVESEKLNQVIQTTTSLTVGLSAIREVADSKAVKSIILKRTEQLKSLVVDKLTFKQTVQQTTAEIAGSTAKKSGTIITNLATKAQLAWNAAITANPIGLIIAGVAALAAGIWLLTKAFNSDTDEIKKNEVAMDGSTFTTKEARDAYNELQFSLQSLDIEYKNIVGSIDDTEAALQKLDVEIQKQITLIKNEYNDKLKEMKDEQEGFWNTLYIGLLSSIDASGNLLAKKLSEQASERADIIKEGTDKENGIITEGEAKKLNIITKNATSIIKSVEDLEQKLTDIRKNGLDKRAALERRQLLSDINSLRTSLSNIIKEFETTDADITKIMNEISMKLADLQFEAKITFIDDQSIKQIQILEDEQIKFNESVEKQKDELDLLVKKRSELIDKAVEEGRELDKKNEKLKESRDEITKLKKLEQGRLSDVQKQRQEIETSIKSNVKLFEKKLQGYSKEKLATLGLIENGEISLKTSQQQIEAQKLLLKDKKLTSGEIQLQSNLYEQLQGFMEEEVRLTSGLIETKSVEEDLNNQINNTTDEIIEKDKYINNLQELTTEEVQQQKDALDKIKQTNDDITHNIISRLKWEREINMEIEKQSIALNKSLSQPISDLRNKFIKDGLKSEEEADRELFKERVHSLQKFYSFKILMAQDDEEAQLWKDKWDEALDELTQKFDDKWQSISSDITNIITDIAAMGANAITEVFSRGIQREFERLNWRLQKDLETSQSTLENQLAANLITQEEYDKKQIELQEETDRKSLELKRKQAKKEKEIALFQVAIDTAVGTAKSLGQGGGLFGPGLAALVIAQGALQAALIASQPLPEFKMGGLIDGKTHEQGGVPLLAEGGEYIIRNDVVSQPGMSGLLDTINQTPQNKSPFQVDNSDFMKELKDTILGITSIPVVNVESEYTKVQRRVNTIETRSRF